MYILIDNRNEVVACSKIVEMKPNGIKLDTSTYCIPTDGEKFIGDVPFVVEVDNLPDDFEFGKYCYAGENGFYLSPVYLGSVEMQKQKAIDAYTLQLMEEGVI